MNHQEAMEARVSRRSYLPAQIPPKQLQALEEVIQTYNRQSGLTMQLLKDGQDLFYGLHKSYGLFTGVKTIILLKGKTADPHLKERAGLYGEQVVLEATKLGLGTCWVGGIYDKRGIPVPLHKGESPICIITAGVSPREKTVHEKMAYTLAGKNGKPLESLYRADMEPPEWFLSGVMAASLAPSDANAQPVRFQYKSGVVTASVTSESGLRMVDLGIAKAHFALAAAGYFAFGNRSAFTKKE